MAVPAKAVVVRRQPEVIALHRQPFHNTDGKLRDVTKRIFQLPVVVFGEDSMAVRSHLEHDPMLAAKYEQLMVRLAKS